MMSAAYTELYTHLHWLQRETLYYQMLCKDLVYPHLIPSHRLILKTYNNKAYDACYILIKLYNANWES